MRPALAWRGTRLPQAPGVPDLRAAADDHEALVRAAMELIVRRDAAHPGYDWIDTKIDPLTGHDYPPDDPVRGRETVYGWIQGRGLEALAGHVRWLRRSNAAHDGAAAALAARLENLLPRLLRRVWDAREHNGGRLFFFMTPQGQPFRLGPDGQRQLFHLPPETPAGFSDLFAAKGMLSAAHLLGDRAAVDVARLWLRRIASDVFCHRFRSDQQTLDLNNPQQSVSGRRSQAPHMILLGAAALWLELEDSSDAFQAGRECLDYVMKNHVNLDGCWPGLPDFAFAEYVGEDGRPFHDSGQVLCDPGHALEFTGLAFKFLRAAHLRHRTAADWPDLPAALASVLFTAFRLGYQPGPQGICKTVDLVTGCPMNADMPWWNLPETMRAALLCRGSVADEPVAAECLRVFSESHNALTCYVRPEHGLAVIQTRSAQGVPVSVIPATSDMDPGYHTGLSLIDCMELLEEKR